MADRNEPHGGAFKERYTELTDGTNEYSKGVALQGTHADATADITTKAFPVLVGGADANGDLQAITATVPAGVDTSGAFATFTTVTTDQSTSDVTNVGFRGVIMYIRITAANDGTLKPFVELKNDRTSNYHKINTAQQEIDAATISPTTEFAVLIFPGVDITNLATGSGIKGGHPITIGKTFRFAFEIANSTGSGWTFTVDYELL